MIFVTRASKHSPVVLSCNKQKDAEEFDDMTVRVKGVPSADSLVIAAGFGNTKFRREQMLSILKEIGPASWDDWYTACAAVDIPKPTFSKNLVYLKKNARIAHKTGHYTVSV